MSGLKGQGGIVPLYSTLLFQTSGDAVPAGADDADKTVCNRQVSNIANWYESSFSGVRSRLRVAVVRRNSGENRNFVAQFLRSTGCRNSKPVLCNGDKVSRDNAGFFKKFPPCGILVRFLSLQVTTRSTPGPLVGSRSAPDQ